VFQKRIIYSSVGLFKWINWTVGSVVEVSKKQIIYSPIAILQPRFGTRSLGGWDFVLLFLQSYLYLLLCGQLVLTIRKKTQWCAWSGTRIFGHCGGWETIVFSTTRIKLLSWQWFIGRLAKGPCILYEWQWSPVDCMRRWCFCVGGSDEFSVSDLFIFLLLQSYFLRFCFLAAILLLSQLYVPMLLSVLWLSPLTYLMFWEFYLIQ
jgi:hypothetical protein